MSTKLNFAVTFCLVAFCYLVSISFSSLGDALTIVGSTIMPTTGFIVPITFYLKVHPNKGICSKEKLLPIIVGVIIVVVSVINILNFYLYKEN